VTTVFTSSYALHHIIKFQICNLKETRDKPTRTFRANTRYNSVIYAFRVWNSVLQWYQYLNRRRSSWSFVDHNIAAKIQTVLFLEHNLPRNVFGVHNALCKIIFCLYLKRYTYICNWWGLGLANRKVYSNILCPTLRTLTIKSRAFVKYFSLITTKRSDFKKLVAIIFPLKQLHEIFELLCHILTRDQSDDHSFIHSIKSFKKSIQIEINDGSNIFSTDLNNHHTFKLINCAVFFL
jgi:hypothetical protein